MEDRFEPSVALRRLLEQHAMAAEAAVEPPAPRPTGATTKLRSLAQRLREAYETLQAAADIIAAERARVSGLVEAVCAQDWTHAPELAEGLWQGFTLSLQACDALETGLEHGDLDALDEADVLAAEGQRCVNEVEQVLREYAEAPMAA